MPFGRKRKRGTGDAKLPQVLYNNPGNHGYYEVIERPLKRQRAAAGLVHAWFSSILGCRTRQRRIFSCDRTPSALLFQLLSPTIEGLSRPGMLSPIVLLKNPLNDNGTRVIRLVDKHFKRGKQESPAEPLPRAWKDLCEKTLGHACDALANAPYWPKCKEKGFWKQRDAAEAAFSSKHVRWPSDSLNPYASSTSCGVGYSNLDTHIDATSSSSNYPKNLIMMFNIGQSCIYHCGTTPWSNDFQFLFESGDVLVFDKGTDWHGMRVVLDESTAPLTQSWLKGKCQSVMVSFSTSKINGSEVGWRDGNLRKNDSGISYDPETDKIRKEMESYVVDHSEKEWRDPLTGKIHKYRFR